MIEVDCNKCGNFGNDECKKYGKDPDIAVKKCAEDGFKNYICREEDRPSACKHCRW